MGKMAIHVQPTSLWLLTSLLI